MNIEAKKQRIEIIRVNKTPKELIDQGYTVMDHNIELTNLRDAQNAGRSLGENLNSVNEVIISKYEGVYDIYAKINESKSEVVLL
ncbi:MAG TPA: hypothetical protein P5277_03115 [Candidatus Paceibacterota bacterium]|nr:hypothetical protein [Candidatus Paceibacterota bacterium]